MLTIICVVFKTTGKSLEILRTKTKEMKMVHTKTTKLQETKMAPPYFTMQHIGAVFK